ncbi:uncharacterized protein LOC144444241 [Glandiceps talaboti]
MPRRKQSKPTRLEDKREEAKGLLKNKGDAKSGDNAQESQDGVPAKRARIDTSKANQKGKGKGKDKPPVRKTRARTARNRLKGKGLGKKQPKKVGKRDIETTDIQDTDKRKVRTRRSAESELMKTASDNSQQIDKYDLIKSRSAKLAKNKETSDKSTEKSPQAPSLERHKSFSESRGDNESDTEMPILQPVEDEGSVQENKKEHVVSSGEKKESRIVTENMTAQEALSRKYALEALLQITHTELHTLSAKERDERMHQQQKHLREHQQLLQQHHKQLHVEEQQSTSGQGNVEGEMEEQQGAAVGTYRSIVKMSDTDKGIVKYQLKSDTLEEQGLKLVYTAQTGDQIEHNPISYGAYRPRKSSKPLDPLREVVKKDNKPPKKPGRHICQFCGRGCAKPSVLKKHIRSHTNERPYPCSICGFAFKTKSNLYKHKKSHAHAIKAGLAPNLDEATKIIDFQDQDNIEDSETDSDDDESITDGSPESNPTNQNIARHQEGDFEESNYAEGNYTKMAPHFIHGHPMTSHTHLPEGAMPMPVYLMPVYPGEAGRLFYSPIPPSAMMGPIPIESHGVKDGHLEIDKRLLSQRLYSRPSMFAVEKPPDSTIVKQSETLLEETIGQEESKKDGTSSPTPRKVEDGEQCQASGEKRGSFSAENVAGFQIDMQTGKAVPVTHNLTPQSTAPPAAKFSNSGAPSPGSECTAPATPKNIDRQSLTERIKQLISQNQAIMDNPMLESVKPRRMAGPRRESVDNIIITTERGDGTVSVTTNKEQAKTSDAVEQQGNQETVAKPAKETKPKKERRKRKDKSKLVDNASSPIGVPVQMDSILAAEMQRNESEAMMPGKKDVIRSILMQGQDASPPQTYTGPPLSPGMQYPSTAQSMEKVKLYREIPLPSAVDMKSVRQGGKPIDMPFEGQYGIPAMHPGMEPQIADFAHSRKPGAKKPKRKKERTTKSGKSPTKTEKCLFQEAHKEMLQKVKEFAGQNLAAKTSAQEISVIQHTNAMLKSQNKSELNKSTVDQEQNPEENQQQQTQTSVQTATSGPYLQPTESSVGINPPILKLYEMTGTEIERANRTCSSVSPDSERVNRADSRTSLDLERAKLVDSRTSLDLERAKLVDSRTSPDLERAKMPRTRTSSESKISDSEEKLEIYQNQEMCHASNRTEKHVSILTAYQEDTEIPKQRIILDYSQLPPLDITKITLLKQKQQLENIVDTTMCSTTTTSVSSQVPIQSPRKVTDYSRIPPLPEDFVFNPSQIQKAKRPTDLSIEIPVTPALCLNRKSSFESVTTGLNLPTISTSVPRLTEPPVSVHPQSASQVSVQPINMSSVSVQPISMSSVSVQPISVSSVSVQPMCVSSVSVQPVSEQPMCVSPVSVQPKCVSPSSVQPVCMSSPVIQSITTSPAVVQSVAVSPVTVQSVSVHSVCVSTTAIQPTVAETIAATSPSLAVCQPGAAPTAAAHVLQISPTVKPVMSSGIQPSPPTTVPASPVVMSPVPASSSVQSRPVVLSPFLPGHLTSSQIIAITTISPSLASAQSQNEIQRSTEFSGGPVPPKLLIFRPGEPISVTAQRITTPVTPGTPVGAVLYAHVPYGNAPATLQALTHVTFCCLQRPQPMYVEQGANHAISMYSNWRVGNQNTNPLGMPTKVLLSLYNSSKIKKCGPFFVSAAITPRGAGNLTHSSLWNYNYAAKTQDATVKKEADSSEPLLTPTSSTSSNGSKDLPPREQTQDTMMQELIERKIKERKMKELLEKTEPSRIPIFQGGYKSNEDYVYVRGRGRGKYVCEECGIRCKKPSMLKKHIRTHTDLRPYHCNFCNFSFKTKGNLTKHMKSKAHNKKCLANGAPICDDGDLDQSLDGAYYRQNPYDDRDDDHQFSDDEDDEGTDSADSESDGERDDNYSEQPMEIDSSSSDSTSVKLAVDHQPAFVAMAKPGDSAPDIKELVTCSNTGPQISLSVAHQAVATTTIVSGHTFGQVMIQQMSENMIEDGLEAEAMSASGSDMQVKKDARLGGLIDALKNRTKGQFESGTTQGTEENMTEEQAAVKSEKPAQQQQQHQQHENQQQQQQSQQSEQSQGKTTERKLTKSEVVGKLSQHLSNKQQLNLQKQMADRQLIQQLLQHQHQPQPLQGQVTDIKRLNQLSDSYSSPTLMMSPQKGAKMCSNPPPILDKYGHITPPLPYLSNMYAYRVSTRVNESTFGQQVQPKSPVISPTAVMKTEVTETVKPTTPSVVQTQLAMPTVTLSSNVVWTTLVSSSQSGHSTSDQTSTVPAQTANQVNTQSKSGTLTSSVGTTPPVSSIYLKIPSTVNVSATVASNPLSLPTFPVSSAIPPVLMSTGMSLKSPVVVTTTQTTTQSTSLLQSTNIPGTEFISGPKVIVQPVNTNEVAVQSLGLGSATVAVSSTLQIPSAFTSGKMSVSSAPSRPPRKTEANQVFFPSGRGHQTGISAGFVIPSPTLVVPEFAKLQRSSDQQSKAKPQQQFGDSLISPNENTRKRQPAIQGQTGFTFQDIVSVKNEGIMPEMYFRYENTAKSVPEGINVPINLMSVATSNSRKDANTLGPNLSTETVPRKLMRMSKVAPPDTEPISDDEDSDKTDRAIAKKSEEIATFRGKPFTSSIHTPSSGLVGPSRWSTPQQSLGFSQFQQQPASSQFQQQPASFVHPMSAQQHLVLGLKTSTQPTLATDSMMYKHFTSGPKSYLTSSHQSVPESTTSAFMTGSTTPAFMTTLSQQQALIRTTAASHLHTVTVNTGIGEPSKYTPEFAKNPPNLQQTQAMTSSPTQATLPEKQPAEHSSVPTSLSESTTLQKQSAGKWKAPVLSPESELPQSQYTESICSEATVEESAVPTPLSKSTPCPTKSQSKIPSQLLSLTESMTTTTSQQQSIASVELSQQQQKQQQKQKQQQQQSPKRKIQHFQTSTDTKAIGSQRQSVIGAILAQPQPSSRPAASADQPAASEKQMSPKKVSILGAALSQPTIYKLPATLPSSSERAPPQPPGVGNIAMPLSLVTSTSKQSAGGTPISSSSAHQTSSGQLPYQVAAALNISLQQSKGGKTHQSHQSLPVSSQSYPPSSQTLIQMPQGAVALHSEARMMQPLQHSKMPGSSAIKQLLLSRPPPRQLSPEEALPGRMPSMTHHSTTADVTMTTTQQHAVMSTIAVQRMLQIDNKSIVLMPHSPHSKPNLPASPEESSKEIQTSPGLLKCSVCLKEFLKPSQLRIHMRIHADDRPFICKECGIPFRTKGHLQKHERSQLHLSKVDAVELPTSDSSHDPRPFKCKECQIAFRIPGHLAKHLRSKLHLNAIDRQGKGLPLDKTDEEASEKSPSSDSELLVLSPSEESDRSIKSPEDDAPDNSKTRKESWESATEGVSRTEESDEMDNAGKECQGKENLSSTLNPTNMVVSMSSENDTFGIVDLRESVYSQIETDDDAERESSENEKDEGGLLDFCTVQWKYKGVEMSLADVDYTGRSCFEISSSRGAKKETKTKPCDSTESWVSNFNGKPSLVGGTEITESLSRPCPICGKIFKTVNYTEKHMKNSHSEIKQFKCDYAGCDRKYACKESFKYHMLTHSREKPHQCHHCGMTFRFITQLRMHVCCHGACKSSTLEECEVTFKSGDNSCQEQYTGQEDEYICQEHKSETPSQDVCQLQQQIQITTQDMKIEDITPRLRRVSSESEKGEMYQKSK